MRLIWAGLLALAVLWPSRALSWLGGMPLDGRAAAVLAGLVLPVLWWMHRGFLDRRLVRIAIAAVLILKVAESALLTQEGLCARFSASSNGAPYNTDVLTIPIDEPQGVLRSWDVRADWRAESPVCTAIVDRPYPVASAFPAWFVNITDFASGGRRDLTMDLSGYARVGERGRLALELDRDIVVSGTIGPEHVSSTGGAPLTAMLDAGVHRIDLRATLTGDRWRLVPTWNDRDGFSAALLTVGPPRSLDGTAGRAMGAIAATLIVALAAAWLLSVIFEYWASPWLLLWCAVAACVLATFGAAGTLERLSGLVLIAAVLVPVAEPHRNLRGAFLLVGVPWLALFAARTLPLVGHFSAYSNDDWLAYQVAGYRIFMHGYWFEGGSKAFDYQPLYRWISGALHLVFGDSSVGESYWDAVCLLLGSLVAFVLVKPIAGFRWAIAAAAVTLATFSLGTIWYFAGRGLSEVAAAGWAYFAAIALCRAGKRGIAAAAGAGAMAVLMFYTRLNHLVFAVFLPALLVPLDVSARWHDVRAALRRVNTGGATIYAATFAAGVALFATRTWWYTGVFGVLYGTSLKYNDTGLRLGTLTSPAVWGKVGHSLSALVWMNEPASPDVRAAAVVAGVILSLLALLQVPRLSRLPFSIAVVTLGACASSLFAHTHNYPGRMSIHLAPFAIAMTVHAGARLFGR